MVNVHTVSTKKYESFIFLQTILVTNVFLLDHYFHQRWILCFCTFTVTLFLYSDFILTIAIIIIDYYYYYHYSEITIIVLGWLLCPPKVTTANSNQKDNLYHYQYISLYIYFIFHQQNMFSYIIAMIDMIIKYHQQILLVIVLLKLTCY